MAQTAHTLPSDGAGRQFGMRGLLSFMLACSLYLALIVALRDLFRWGDPWSRYPFPIAAAAVIPVVWFALWWLYWRWGLRHAIIVHAAGPILFGGFVIVASLFAVLVILNDALAHGTQLRPDLDELRDFGNLVVLSLYYGCTVSTLVSFPAAIVMLLYLATKS